MCTYRIGLSTIFEFKTFWIPVPNGDILLASVSGQGYIWGFPGALRNLPANAGDMDSIPGLGRSPGEGNGNPLQNSCLENPMDGGAWQAIVHGVAKSQTWLSD